MLGLAAVLGCSSADDFQCPPGEQPWWCEAICQVQFCDGTFWEKTVGVRLCAGASTYDAHLVFWQAVYAPGEGIADCTVPECTATNATPYGAQAWLDQPVLVELTETVGASGGPWFPPPNGCQ